MDGVFLSVLERSRTFQHHEFIIKYATVFPTGCKTQTNIDNQSFLGPNDREEEEDGPSNRPWPEEELLLFPKADAMAGWLAAFFILLTSCSFHLTDLLRKSLSSFIAPTENDDDRVLQAFEILDDISELKRGCR
jgi:hypothetical protein